MIHQTHYEVLQVAPDACPEIIRAAYELQSLLWHPERNPDSQAEAEYRMKGIAFAYEVLSDPVKRAAYNAKLTAEANVKPKPTSMQESSSPQQPPSALLDSSSCMVLVEANSPAISHEQILLESIGIETLDDVFTPILVAGQSVPCIEDQLFSTGDNHQEVITIHLLRGRSVQANQNRSLGRFDVLGIKPQLRGLPQINLRFQIVSGGIYLELLDIDRQPGLSIQRQQEKEAPSALPPPPRPSSSEWDDDSGLTGLTSSSSPSSRLAPDPKQDPVQIANVLKDGGRSSWSFVIAKLMICVASIFLIGPAAGYWPAIVLALLLGYVLDRLQASFDALPTFARVAFAILSFFLLAAASLIGQGIKDGRITL